jgi:hypothetical protein
MDGSSKIQFEIVFQNKKGEGAPVDYNFTNKM